MCKTTLSVAWDGRLYDCDFNQMLGLTTNHGAPDHISGFDMTKLAKRQIVITVTAVRLVREVAAAVL